MEEIYMLIYWFITMTTLVVGTLALYAWDETVELVSKVFKKEEA